MSTQTKQSSKREQILNLKQQGLRPSEISEKLKIPQSTVDYHYYEEIRERHREYMREYMRRRMLLIDAFTDFETGYTLGDLRKKVGGKPSHLRRDIELYLKSGLLLMTVENGIEVYRLNPNSPYHKVVNGFFEREKEKLLRKK